jgi:hypothetical protein
MFTFGSGALFAFPSGGNTAPNPTPIKFGTLQDVSLDVSGELKELYGQKQFPEAVARGKHKITGKAKFAAINGKLLNDLFFGLTLGTGMIKMALDEAQTVPATPFTITVANAATFKQDWGVRYASGLSAGLPLMRVTASPATGQYSVNSATGVYTFAAGDQGAQLQISYTYTAASTGTQINVTNQLMGFAPNFQVLLENTYSTSQYGILLYAAVASKLSIATKQDDFLIPEFDFEAFAAPSGVVMDMYSTE